MSGAMITLLTDFGYRDAYVGEMKGVIAGRCDARVIDLTHGVPPGDINAAAYLLDTARPYFPPGTVHVAVVDPGVGSERPILAAEAGGQRFLAPDNGLLTDVLAAAADATVVQVTREDLFLPAVSRTFRGRDIFAPVAAAIATGTRIDELGPVADTYATLPRRRAERTDAGIEGEIVYVDHFGNLVTNITAEMLAELPAEAMVIEVDDRRIRGLVSSYAAVEAGALMGIIGSTNRLEISISGGNAADQLELDVGDRVSVRHT